MILDKHVEITWSNRNKSWYEDKGYIWTKNKDVFLARVDDLMPNANVKVLVKCDYCDKKFKRDFSDATGTIACKECAGNIISDTKRKNILQYNLDNTTIDGDACYLKVNDETTAIFDIEYLSTFVNYGWFEDNNGYIKTHIKDDNGKYKQIQMHRLITGDYGYDHISRNKADNRKSNLRPATAPQNSMNIAPFKNKKCLYRGVSYHKQGEHYYARISIREKVFRIGVFSDEIACANAYNYFAKELYGEYAYQNDVPYMSLDEWKSHRTSRQPVEDILEQAKRWI